MWAGRSTSPRRPGTDRQPSQPASVVASSTSIFRVDQDRQGGGALEGLGLVQAWVAALGRSLEYHHPERHMDLGSSQPGAIGVFHGLDHVGDKRMDLWRDRVENRPGLFGEHRMAHAGDFENGHGRTMRLGGRRSRSATLFQKSPVIQPLIVIRFSGDSPGGGGLVPAAAAAPRFLRWAFARGPARPAGQGKSPLLSSPALRNGVPFCKSSSATTTSTRRSRR